MKARNATLSEFETAPNDTRDVPQSVDFSDKSTRSDDMEDSLEEWISELQEATEDARGAEVFRQWLDAQAKLHDYSPRNTALIHMQKPDASMVAGFWTWQNEFDRSVKEGESAIWIWRPNTITAKKCPHCGNAPNYHEDNEDLNCPLAPDAPEQWDSEDPNEWTKGEILTGFSPAPVFDVSQTEGKPLPESPDTDAEAVEAGQGEDVLTALQDAAREIGFPVEVVDVDEWDRDAKAIARTSEDPPEIEIQDRDPAAAAGDLAHEIAHAVLHTGWDNPERPEREIEAEAVAYVVGRYFGLDTSGSKFYLAAWAGNEPEEITERMKTISNTAAKIIEAADD
ncbi:ImmA/IrrE family metallo-endopeptidase [Halorientalis brevis]|nr:ImmA/IrrE family metallo-endopeptidase [Halorientalis brevis]